MADVADIARIRSDGVRVARVWSVARVERGGCETNSLLSSVAALSLALRAGRSTRRLRRTERCFVRDVSQTRGRKTTRTPRGRSRDDTWSPVALGRSDLECPLDARAPRAAPQRRASIPHVSSWCSFITTTPRTTPRRRARCVFARRPTTRLARRAPASARAAPRSPPRFRDRIVIGPSDADARLPPSLPFPGRPRRPPRRPRRRPPRQPRDARDGAPRRRATRDRARGVGFRRPVVARRGDDAGVRRRGRVHLAHLALARVQPAASRRVFRGDDPGRLRGRAGHHERALQARPFRSDEEFCAPRRSLRVLSHTGSHTTALAWWTPFLKDFPGASLHPPLAGFNPRPRRLSTPLLTPFNSPSIRP